jgi:S-adenosylmethionine decarboxylase proenzyme
MISTLNANLNGRNKVKRTLITIDVRFFSVMLLATISIFFILGTLTMSDHNASGSIGNTSSQHLERSDLNEHHVNFKRPSYEDLGTGDGVLVTRYSTSNDGAVGGRATNITQKDHQGGVQLPSGQHLLVDIKNVEADFLNSEKRLSNAMVETVKAAGLDLLSYHCHSLIPAGVSCVGVLLQSHISFHTWPEEGVITLDLFTSGDNPLLPAVADVERLFGIPREVNLEDDDEDEDEDDEVDGEVTVTWSHELRGFRHGEYLSGTKTNYLDSRSELSGWVLGRLDVHKKQVIATMSEHYRIDIWDIMEEDALPSYEDGLKLNFTIGDPRWLQRGFTASNRILFMNGSLQVCILTLFILYIFIHLFILFCHQM